MVNCRPALILLVLGANACASGGPPNPITPGLRDYGVVDVEYFFVPADYQTQEGFQEFFRILEADLPELGEGWSGLMAERFTTNMTFYRTVGSGFSETDIFITLMFRPTVDPEIAMVFYQMDARVQYELPPDMRNAVTESMVSDMHRLLAQHLDVAPTTRSRLSTLN